MKILLFIEENDIEDFFNKIKEKYYIGNKKFMKYFENNI